MPPAHDEAPSARPRRRLPLLLLGALALVVGARAALPSAVAWGIATAVERTTGLPARVDNVDLWLLRGAIAVEGAIVASRPGASVEPALLRWERLYLDVAWSGLLRDRIRVQDVSLDGPRLRLERADAGGVDLAFLEGLSGPAPVEETDGPESPSEPWPVQLDRLLLRRLSVEVVDPQGGVKPAVAGLAELSLADLAYEDGALSVGALEIRAPSLDVAREFTEGLAASGAPASPEAPAPRPDADADPLRYRADRIEIEGGDLVLRVGDRSLRVAAALSAQRASLSGEPFQVKLRAEIEDGSIELDGSLGLAPLFFQGGLRWRDLPVPVTVLAARPELASWIRSCHTRGTLQIELRGEPGSNGEPALLRVGGEAAVEALELANPGDREEILVAFGLLAVDLREAVVPLVPESPEPVRVALGSVRLVEPRLLYTTPATSLATLAAANGEPPSGNAAPTGPELQLSVESMKIVDGDLRFVDREVGYRGRMRDLDVSVEGLRVPGTIVTSARVSARPPSGKRLALTGSLSERSGALELDLEQLALPPLNAYAEPAGYRLTRGHASLRTVLRVEDGVLDANNTLELHDLAVDALHPEDFRKRFGMPLDLTLALLRDGAGRISISVPVELGLDGSTTRVGLTSLLQSALRQALLGAVTTPLKMGGFALSALGFGGSEPLASVPGRTAWARDQDERIASTAALLAARPGLALTLRGQSGPSDQAPLAEAMLIERLEAGGDLPQLDGAGLLARRRIAEALRARGRGVPGTLEAEDRALLARYLAVVEVPAASLEALARQRAEAARDALVEAGVDPKRLTLGDVGSGEPGVALELTSAS